MDPGDRIKRLHLVTWSLPALTNKCYAPHDRKPSSLSPCYFSVLQFHKTKTERRQLQFPTAISVVCTSVFTRKILLCSLAVLQEYFLYNAQPTEMLLHLYCVSPVKGWRPADIITCWYLILTSAATGTWLLLSSNINVVNNHNEYRPQEVSLSVSLCHSWHSPVSLKFLFQSYFSHFLTRYKGFYFTETTTCIQRAQTNVSFHIFTS